MDDSDQRRDETATNPFVAFRRFADEQMASLVNSVFGALQSSPMRRQEAIEQYEAWLKKARDDADQDLKRENEEAHRIAAIFSRASREAVDSADDATPKAADVSDGDGDSSSIYPFKRWQDSQPSNGSEYAKTSTEQFPYHFIFDTEQSESSYDSERLRCPYSPDSSEQDDPQPLDSEMELWQARAWRRLNNAAHKFEEGQRNTARNSTEDNFDASHDSHEEAASDPAAQAWRPSASEKDSYIRIPQIFSPRLLRACLKLDSEEARRQCARTLLRLELEGHEDEEDVEMVDEDEDRPGTELDAYSQSSAVSENNPPTKILSSPSTTTAHDSATDQVITKPSVLSMLTTTETRTLPDGSSTTRMVLKKRFSDGVEESTEKTFTKNPEPIQEAGKKTLGSIAPPSQQQRKESNAGEKKGWFWS